MSSIAVSIGKFDGLHRGHQKILKAIKREGKKKNAKPLLLCFSSHPNLEKVLTTEHEKRELCRKYGVEVKFIDFDKIRRLSPESFFTKVLLHKMHTRSIVVSKKFRFGYRRAGDVKTLKKLCKKYNVELHVVNNLKFRNAVISSSLIKKKILSGNIPYANRMLGYEYNFSGIVVPGDKIGRKIGFPTINIKVPQKKLLPKGVFLSYTIIKNKKYKCLTNIGYKPTIYGNKNKKLFVEAHIPGFRGNLYNKAVRIYLLKKLRDEVKFDTLEELITQIKKDIRKLAAAKLK
jgi:riboflavin kinase/FMN adenylyltransferase